MKKTLQLQGLRTIGCFLIVACHAAFKFDGGIGNAIFFALAGFLVVKPFMEEDYKINSFREVLVFYLKKIVTICIPYWLIIFSTNALFEGWTNIFKGEWDKVWLAACFYDCPAHFWFLQQILVMYLFTPLIILLHMGCKRIIKWKYFNIIFGAFLIGSALIFYFFVNENVIFFYSGGAKAPFRVYSYLIGMGFAYFYTIIVQNKITLNKLAQHLAAIIPFSLIVLSIFSVYIFKINVGWTYQFLSGILAALVIFLLTWLNNSWLSIGLRFKPLVEIGNVTYVIYIIHVFVIPQITAETPRYALIVVLIVSIALAYLLQKVLFDPINKLCQKFIYPKILGTQAQ